VPAARVASFYGSALPCLVRRIGEARTRSRHRPDRDSIHRRPV